MIRDYFFVPDPEHQDDVDYFSDIITDAGGKILSNKWSGSEDDDAIIVYQCQDKKQLSKVKEALANA